MMMYKLINYTCKIVLVSCACAFVLGCGEESTDSVKTPTIVARKIESKAQPDNGAASHKASQKTKVSRTFQATDDKSAETHSDQKNGLKSPSGKSVSPDTAKREKDTAVGEIKKPAGNAPVQESAGAKEALEKHSQAAMSGPQRPETANKQKDPSSPPVAERSGQVSGVAHSHVAAASAVPQLANTESLYDPSGKVDPFAPPVSTQPDVGRRQIERRAPRTPLEKIDLSQLKLVGIIVTSSGKKALVEEASGKGYIIARGTYIGTHSGQVEKILKDKVVVEEQSEDILGHITTQEKELKLQKPPGE